MPSSSLRLPEPDGKKKKPRKSLLKHLVAGGVAGLCETSVCHPLDTIKTRMQLRRQGGSSAGLFRTGFNIVRREGPLALYKGLTAVVSGIVPKMAVRFSSFEFYKQQFADENGVCDNKRVFVSGLCAGTTEAVMVVTPMEVCKIRLQSQFHSMMDPQEMANVKYRNVTHAACECEGCV